MAAITIQSAGSFAIVNNLLERVIRSVAYQTDLLSRVNFELERLRRRLLRVRSLLREAERRQINDDSLQLWLQDLKEAAYEVDDLLDDYETEVLRIKAVRNCGSRLVFAINYFILAQRIVRIKHTFNEITQEREINLSQLDHGTMQLDTPVGNETTSLLREPYIVGRIQDKEHIIRLLFSPSDHMVAGSSSGNIPVLPIVGLGGIGKTTLAQLVFRDARVEQYFHLRIWVCVSDDFDVKRILKEIIGYFSNETVDCTNLNMLQRILMEKLRGKRFLLVLDDVWNEDRGKWKSVCAPLMSNRSSIVIVTTQNKKVADMVGTMKPYHLKGLVDDDHWSLLSSHAFDDGEADENPKLEEIGMKISRKMKGLPYGAKVLGRFLRSKKDESTWTEISESEIWEMASSSDRDILSTMRLSFAHLTPQLKLCFAFCSLFPKGYKFQKSKLAQMWMASSLIQPQGMRRMEDIGDEYFDELACRSFFQGDGNSFVMHELVHELARYVSSEEYFTVGDRDFQTPPETLRHLSWCTGSEMQKLHRPRQLRTLILLGPCQLSLNPILRDMSRARCLRVLDLSYCEIKVLPTSVGRLKHLRYLGLSNTKIRKLPTYIAHLFHLQTLQLENCELGSFPTFLYRLIRLRHLNADAEVVAKIPYIGRLTELQELKLFKVHNTRGYGINQLRYLDQIRGHLKIKIPHNLPHRGSIRPQLHNKKHLTSLEFQWVYNRTTNRRNFTSDHKVLESLEPHANLKQLTMRRYRGIRYPYWMTDQYLHDIEGIRLSDCKILMVGEALLPPLEKFPFLKHLELQQIRGTEQIGFRFFCQGFPMLESLCLYDMPEFETRRQGFQDNEYFCPGLLRLSINKCPGLLELPLLPPCLRELTISDVGLVSLPGFVEFDGAPGNVALTSLCIAECPRLASLREGLLQHHLPALASVSIDDCQSLSSLPEHIRAADNLDATIDRCPNLTPLPEWITFRRPGN